MQKKRLISIYNKLFKMLAGHGLGNFPPIRAAHSLLVSRLKSTVAEVDGHKMFLGSTDTLGLSIRSIHEPLETELVKQKIKKGDVVLDIGANIGYYTLIFAKLVGEEGRVYAFEPEPRNFSLLKKNVETNGYKNVVLLQKAASNQSGKTRLFLSKTNTVDHLIYDSHDGRRFIDIESMKLDDYFPTGQQIDFIKMDIQGAEYRAIQGMSGLLRNNPQATVVTEFSPARLEISGVSSQEYLDLLLESGCEISEIAEKEKKIKPVDISELLKTYTVKKKNRTNLLCLRKK